MNMMSTSNAPSSSPTYPPRPHTKSRTAIDFDACRNDVLRAAVVKILSGKSTTIKQCLLHVGFNAGQSSNRTMQMRVRRQVQKMVQDGEDSEETVSTIAKIQRHSPVVPITSASASASASASMASSASTATSTARSSVPSTYKSKSRQARRKRMATTPLYYESDDISLSTSLAFDESDMPKTTSMGNYQQQQQQQQHDQYVFTVPTSITFGVHGDREDEHVRGPFDLTAPLNAKTTDLDSLPSIPLMVEGEDSPESFTGTGYHGSRSRRSSTMTVVSIEDEDDDDDDECEFAEDPFAPLDFKSPALGTLVDDFDLELLNDMQNW